MTLSRTILLSFVATISSSVAAVSAPIAPNDTAGNLNLHDAVNLLTGQSFTTNRDLIPFKAGDDEDRSFLITSPSTPLISLSAGNSNVFGHYSDLGTGRVLNPTGVPGAPGIGFTGAGTASDPFAAATFSPDPTGTIAGLYLSVPGGNVLYSEEALNAGGVDYLISYDLTSFGPISVYASDGRGSPVLYTFTNPVLLGWEDVPGGDNDYNDAVFLADLRPTPLPEPEPEPLPEPLPPVPLPAAGWMLLAGLGGLAGMRRFRKG